MADKKVIMSRERYEEIVKELEYLQTVREKEVAEQIKEARSYGDLSENSEYDEAKTEQGKLYSKIAELTSLRDNAEIVEKTGRVGAIGIGSKVTVLDVEFNEEMEYTIVGSQEANPAIGRIEESVIKEVLFLDTIPPKEGQKCDKIKYLSAAPMLADAMSFIYHETSVSRLFV